MEGTRRAASGRKLFIGGECGRVSGRAEPYLRTDSRNLGVDMVVLVCSTLRIPLEHREGRDGKKHSGHLKRHFLRATHNYA